MIAVVDYGVGNLSSVANMIRKAGGDVVISSEPVDILSAEKIVLPGVGHFDYAMQMLDRSGLRSSLDRFALELKRPVLGICLGAQILGRGSEEGSREGLGWIDMVCKKLPPSHGLRIPHMGWNQIVPMKQSDLLAGLAEGARFYFVHSYFMTCSKAQDILATASHGIDFTCAVQVDNIAGVQFHPEKSLRHGLELMRAFVRQIRHE